MLDLLFPLPVIDSRSAYMRIMQRLRRAIPQLQQPDVFIRVNDAGVSVLHVMGVPQEKAQLYTNTVWGIVLDIMDE